MVVPVDISIVIVTYKSKEYIMRCLESIRESVQGLTTEIIIVDNASGDGLGEFLNAKFPEAIWIENEKNEGFAKAVNQGANLASGRYLLILNPDTQLLSNTLKVLLNFLEHDQQDCIVGAPTFDERGKSIPSCRSLPHIKNIIKYPLLLILRGKLLKTPRRYLLDLWEQNETIDVTQYNGYITGACILATLDFFKKLGGFDEQYFMYFEDADFGFRIARSGHPAFLVAEAAMIHHGGYSSSQNPFTSLYAIEAYLHYIRKNLAFFHAAAYKICFFFIVLSWVLGSWLKRRRADVKILLHALKLFIPTWLGGSGKSTQSC